MSIKEVKETSKLLVDFVKMCENDLQEDEHIIKQGNEITYEQYLQIEKLINKLNNCSNYVNANIFK